MPDIPKITDWIQAIAAIVAALATIATAFIAYYGFKSWRDVKAADIDLNLISRALVAFNELKNWIESKNEDIGVVARAIENAKQNPNAMTQKEIQTVASLRSPSHGEHVPFFNEAESLFYEMDAVWGTSLNDRLFEQIQLGLYQVGELALKVNQSMEGGQMVRVRSLRETYIKLNIYFDAFTEYSEDLDVLANALRDVQRDIVSTDTKHRRAIRKLNDGWLADWEEAWSKTRGTNDAQSRAREIEINRKYDEERKRHEQEGWD